MIANPQSALRNPQWAAWWFDAFPLVPYAKAPPGEKEMLTLLAYDISDQKRLAKVARICEDYGVRVQYSLFECWLEDDRFGLLWDKLSGLIDPGQDRLAAYSLDAAAARRREFAGDSMVATQPAVCYIV